MLNLTVPDTVTTWVADAFAISESSAFGIAEMPATVLAFQPFFVSLSLPYSVIRGEEMTVIATVFNYYHENLTVSLQTIIAYLKNQVTWIIDVFIH